jgi:hypothetical protein
MGKQERKRKDKKRKEKEKEDLTPKDGEKTKWAKQYKLSHRCS